MELMTTLHGSAVSLRRRVGGCVPLEGTIAPARDPFKSVAPLFRSDPIGRSEPDPGFYDTIMSLYQNHLSKTSGSVTFQLA